MEFFDAKDNWVEDKVRHGRSWTLDELRGKSNVDLHKLWFVLHKERNMLLTMEEIYGKKCESFPSPERLAKVDQSMENILEVVEERNVAFNLLDKGKTDAFVAYKRYNSFGFIQQYQSREYLVPWFLNKWWKLKFHYKRLPYWSKFYRTMHRVNLRKERKKVVKTINYETKQILKKFNNLEGDAEYQSHLKQFLVKKYGYKPPQPYHQLVRRPKPTDLPKKLAEKLNNNEPQVKTFYDEF